MSSSAAPSITSGHLRLHPPPLSATSRGHPPLRGTVRLSGANDKPLNCDFGLRCNAISKPQTQEFAEVFQNNVPFIKWHEIVDDDIEREALEVVLTNKIKECIDAVKSMLGSMGDGEISVSAYDTAWVALVEDVNGSGAPQFPSSLEWIAKNQLSDGSWGDDGIFSAHDRLINTLACVIALKTWNIHPDKYKKGIEFFRENICKLESENEEHMPIGFEVAFPSLVEIARGLDIEVPTDSPFLQQIYAKRDVKLTKIPKEIMHKVPTTLLHSLEGMEGLQWEQLLKLQCKDGSFLFSPSSTAYALMNTKDENCLKYLSKAVQKFNGGVPNVYPVDMFEHIWAVDRLQRLGISRYFEPQLRECIDYVARYWTEKGICWARNTHVEDIDDTAMAFRLLRLYGHQVSADVFKNFKKGDEFFCFAGQSNQAVTGMYNLYRASQVAFAGEKILDDAKQFAYQFLREKQAANELLDKWIITKDLPGEVGYALDVPWFANLPRIESRFYIEQYGGEDDIWIGKTLYRMPYVNNNTYLELAKQDYNSCQALHRCEWDTLQKWYKECELGDFGVSRKTLLLAYFLATASIFETERSRERLTWAKTAVLVETISSHSDQEETSSDQRKAFVHEFLNNATKPRNGYINGRASDSNKIGKGLVKILLGTLNHLSLDLLVAHGQDVGHHLRQAWEDWLVNWQEEGDKHVGEAELLVRTIILSAGYSLSEELLSHPQYQSLLTLTNTICYQLRRFQKQKAQDNGSYIADTDSFTTPQIESDMQQLAQLVLNNSEEGIDSKIKNIFLTVAKSFYYTAYFSTGIINLHVAKVLFEKVE